MIRLRVATYNVHKCKGMDWRVSPDRIADVMCTLDADIIAVQEIMLSQAHAIANRTATPFSFGEARKLAAEPYGNAVFTRLAVLVSENYDLTVPGREPRQAVRVTVALPPGEPVHVFAVHLGTSFLERRAQARRLLSPEVLNRSGVKGARIVAGDFNEWTRGLATRMLSEHLESADIVMHLKRGRTYPALLPFLHLDHIYYDRAFYLREMHLHRTPLALRASDHLPLVADFEILPGSRAT